MTQKAIFDFCIYVYMDDVSASIGKTLEVGIVFLNNLLSTYWSLWER